MANNASPNPAPLLMTRPLSASKAFVNSFPDEMRARIDPVYSPLLEIRGRDLNPTTPSGRAAIFTSKHGVKFGPNGNEQPAYCVGSATAGAAVRNGWHVVEVSETAEELVASLLLVRPHMPFVHYSGVHTRGDIVARLNAAALKAKNTVVYDQIARSLSGEAQDLIESVSLVLVPLFSPRTAAQFAVGAPRATSVYVIALSETVSECLNPAAFKAIDVATKPNGAAMREAIRRVLSDLSTG